MTERWGRVRVAMATLSDVAKLGAAARGGGRGSKRHRGGAMTERWGRVRVAMATLSDVATLATAAVLVVGSSSVIIAAFVSGYIGIAVASVLSGAAVLGVMIGARAWL